MPKKVSLKRKLKPKITTNKPKKLLKVKQNKTTRKVILKPNSLSPSWSSILQTNAKKKQPTNSTLFNSEAPKAVCIPLNYKIPSVLNMEALNESESEEESVNSSHLESSNEESEEDATSKSIPSIAQDAEEINEKSQKKIVETLESLSSLSSNSESDDDSYTESEQLPAQPRQSAKNKKKTKTGDYSLHPVETGCILFLHKNSSVAFNGFMQIEILHGAVEIMGKILTVDTKSYPVYSPRGAAILNIINKNSSDSDLLALKDKKKSLKAKLLNLGLDEFYTNEFIDYKLKNETVVALCKQFHCKSTQFIEENLSQTLYPNVSNNLRCIFRNYIGDDWNIFKVNPQWEAIVDVANGKDSKTVICGGRGLGKSSLLRYLTNKLLNFEENQSVTIVDLDPGQPEFTVPGSISIVKVKEPLLGPNFTHLQQPEKCIFVAQINVQDHLGYLNNVSQLLEALKENEGPVLVNYMGFTKGIGINLLASVICMLKPTVVVQIDSAKKRDRNFSADLWPECILQNAFDDFKDPNEFLQYNLFKVDSVFAHSSSGWLWKPREVREMCIFSYFSQILPSGSLYLTESSVKIYRTSIGGLDIIFQEKNVHPMCINAHLVALAEASLDILGWGIVRAVDMDNEMLYLLTPLPENQLENVSTLLLGSVTLPPAIYLRHHSSIQGLAPYTFKGELSSFAKTPKRAMLHKRKKQ